MAAGLLLAAPMAQAQGHAVTLYGGARAGGEFYDENDGGAKVKLDDGGTGALSFEWLFSDGQQGQIFYSFQRTALPGSVANQSGEVPLNISYLHAGGRVFFEGSYNTHAGYVVGGLGVTHFAPSGNGLSSEVRPSGNLGLGFQWMLTPQIALRGEVRGYLTLVNSNGGFFCSGGCVVSIRGDTVSQFDALLGVSIGF